MGDKVIDWSGWLNKDNADLYRFIDGIRCQGGNDWEEAIKTALSFYDSKLRDDFRKSIIIHYTDAGPHLYSDISSRKDKGKRGYTYGSRSSNPSLELEALGDMFDWTKICRGLVGRCSMYTIMNTSGIGDTKYYIYSTLLLSGHII